MTRHILLTGLPGVGKTTIIKRLAYSLASHQPDGFFTQEIRENGIRKGFELVTLEGRRQLLSHVNIPGPHRVGRGMAWIWQVLTHCLKPSTYVILLLDW